MTTEDGTWEVFAADLRFQAQIALVREHWTPVRRLWLDGSDLDSAGRIRSQLPPEFWLGCGMPGLGNIKITRDGCFEFAEDGQPAVIIPCYDTIPGMLDANAARHVEHLVDLVAVDLDRPDRFWRRRGDALVLGGDFLELAGQEGAPTPVFRSPLTWLRSGGAGIVILDWEWVPDLLLGFELIAEDLALGTRLEVALAPSIMVMEAA